MQFLARFMVGGLLIAMLPIVASRFGSRMAGLIAVLPLTIGVGLIALYQAKGITPIKGAAIGSIFTLPATLVFLILITLGAGRLPISLTFLLALLAWLAVAASIYLVSH